MSPIGSPDFNQQPTAAPTSNLGETPNRVLMGGGSNSQSGRWLWASGFESGLAEWYIAGSRFVALDSAIAYQGANSATLTTQALANDYARILKILMPYGSSFGLEMAFAIGLEFFQYEISFIILGKNKANNLKAQGEIIITVNPGVSANLYYVNISGARVLIANIKTQFETASFAFRYIKIVYDPWENVIKRVYFNRALYELNVSGRLVGSADETTTFDIMVTTLAADSVKMWIDNVIITADEP